MKALIRSFYPAIAAIRFLFRKTPPKSSIKNAPARILDGK